MFPYSWLTLTFMLCYCRGVARRLYICHRSSGNGGREGLAVKTAWGNSCFPPLMRCWTASGSQVGKWQQNWLFEKYAFLCECCHRAELSHPLRLITLHTRCLFPEDFFFPFVFLSRVLQTECKTWKCLSALFKAFWLNLVLCREPWQRGCRPTCDPGAKGWTTAPDWVSEVVCLFLKKESNAITKSQISV